MVLSSGRLPFASLLLGVGPNGIRLVWRNLFPQAHYAVWPTFQNRFAQKPEHTSLTLAFHYPYKP